MARIIDLHRVTDGRLLERLLLHLKRTTLLVSMEELEKACKEGRKLRKICHITIDDGDLSSYQVIFPILKRMHIPATLFISPGICLEGKNYWFQEIGHLEEEALYRMAGEAMEKDPRLVASFPGIALLKTLKIDQINRAISKYYSQNKMQRPEPQNVNSEQIIEMDRSGLVTIGAHTMNHPILANEEDEKSSWEINRSVESLEELLEHKVNYFAYPNGLPGLDYGPREMEYVKKAGCTMAFSNHLDNFSHKDDLLKIPRYALDIPFFRGPVGNHSITKAKLLLGPRWDSLKSLYSRDEGMKRLELKKRMKEISS